MRALDLLPTDEAPRVPSQSEQAERSSMTTVADKRTFTTATVVDASHPQHEQVRVLVSELLRGGREAILEHSGQEYRLRITQNGKLILTK
jgi:hemin uptake protein HemP